MNYFAIAVGLRIVSSNSLFRNTYRQLGNRKPQRPINISKSRWVWEHVTAAGHCGADKTLLELGTGWTHANSLYTALMTDARVVAFDVWDNRSFSCTQDHIARIATAIAGDPSHSEQEKNRARERAAACAEAKSFDDLYKILRIEYSIHPSGIPEFPEGSFDMIYSVDVLEHVDRESFADLVRVWRGLLKFGGKFIALIGLDDHTTHYDQSKSMKEYLFYSEGLWRYLFANKLQYVNRLTFREIEKLVSSNGFVVDQAEVDRCDVPLDAVHPNYRWQSKEEIEAITLRLYATAAAEASHPAARVGGCLETVPR